MGKEFVVSQDGTGDYSTIAEAIENADVGTKIYVKPGSYEEHLEIDKDIELIGDKEDKPQVYVEKGTVCTVTSDAKISFFEFFNTDYSEPEEEEYDDEEDEDEFDSFDDDDDDDFGYSDDEDDDEDGDDFFDDGDDNDDSGDDLFPLVDIKGNAVFNNCIVRQSLKIGIGVIEDCTPTISECSISECNYTGIFTVSAPIITDCNFEKNKIAHIVVDDEGKPTITNCNILYGRGKSVGILFSSDSKGKVTNCHISDNLYGVFLSDNASPVIANGEFYNNKISGISCGDDAAGTICNCSVYNNGEYGIELIKDSWTEVYASKIYNNEENGIRVKDSANVKVDTCEIYENNQIGINVEDFSSGEIRNTQSYRNSVSNYFFQDNVYVTVENCKSLKSEKYGLVFEGDADGTISNAEIMESGECEVLIRGDASPQFIDCKFTGSIGVWSEEDAACEFKDCEFSDCKENSIVATGHSSLFIKDSQITEGDCRFYDHSRPIVTNCKFSEGSISVENISKPTIINCLLDNYCIIISNRAAGIYKNCKINGSNSGIEVYNDALNIEGNPETGEAESHRGTPKPIIEDCEIFGSESYNLYIGEADKGTYKNCNIHGSSGVGVYVKGNPELENFEIHNCNIGVEIESGEVTYTNCNFHDNKQDTKEDILDYSDEDFEDEVGDE